MKTTLELPLPHVSKGRFASIYALTDEELFRQMGIRIAFTERTGGVSEGAYASLNLGDHVGDDGDAVAENRELVCTAFGIRSKGLIVPNQVHGDHIVVVADEDDSYERAFSQAREGADAVVVEVPDVATLLCYADCVPIIIVSPTGRFAVVHAGWRGVLNGIAPRAVAVLAELDKAAEQGDTAGAMNVYIGPYIHAECFETGADVCALFADRFGSDVVLEGSRVDLGHALRNDLAAAGIASSRVVDVGVCTICSNDRFFSYRAQRGTAGRHGAFAIRFRKG